MSDVGSEEWIHDRDALRAECANHDPGAIAFLAALGAYVEMWDDFVDKDKEVSADAVHNTMGAGLLDIACNPWFQANREFLAPVMVMMISAYLTSEELCTDPDIAVRQRAFHLRNYPLEFYPVVAFVTGGMQHMRRMDPKVRRFFSFETFEQWEFANG